MKKQKLLHIMMGKHNPDMQRGLESVFECKHLDWTETFTGDIIKEEEEKAMPALIVTQQQNVIRKVHGFDPRNPSGEAREVRIPSPVLEAKSVVNPAGELQIDTRLPEESTVTKKSPFDSVLLKAYEEFKPDVVFMHLQRPGIISHTTLEVIKKSVLVSWCGDVREELPQHYVDLGKHIDVTLFTNMEDVDKLRKAGVKGGFLQVGFDSQKFNPKGPVDNESYPEIIFMGSNYQHHYPLSNYRESMVKKLKDVFGDKFGVYGGNWGSLGNEFINDYAIEGKAYRSCKIAISLSHFERTKYASDRLFRILGTGAFCLTHTYPELEKDFEPGKDLDVFNSIDELIAKIKYYLENEKERKTIAASGCEKARKNFTWHNFAENLKVITDKIGTKEFNNMEKSYQEKILKHYELSTQIMCDCFAIVRIEKAMAALSHTAAHNAGPANEMKEREQELNAILNKYPKISYDRNNL